jgi:cytochrome oxidase Cu insertion factor (SCO1/SenC/PrrC family)
MKRALALIVMLTFVLGLAAVALSATVTSATKEVKGTITKIEGNKLTIKQADGKEVTVEVKDAKGLKVGDNVEVKDGVAKKEEVKKKKAIEGC